MQYLLEGLLLGLAYVAPIGMQNMYIINAAIKFNKARSYQIALITAFFDISLALACFFGLGFLLARFPPLRHLFLAAASIAVIYIGFGLVKSKPVLDESIELDGTIAKTAWMCFAVTWLNPQAIVDGTLLLGSYRASLSLNDAKFFIMGVALASLSWFLTLNSLISTFKSTLGTRTLGYINVACGLIIIFYGLRLAYSFLGLFP